MRVIYRNRISGVSTRETPMTSYGPGNMLDNSNRNQWVSSSQSDRITVDCNNQTDAFFMSNLRADSATYSFLRYPFSRIDDIVRPSITTKVCNTTSGSPNVTMTSSGVTTSGLHVGMYVEGSGIPANTKITSISSSTSFIMNNSATLSNSPVTLYFSDNVVIIKMEDQRNHGLYTGDRILVENSYPSQINIESVVVTKLNDDWFSYVVPEIPDETHLEITGASVAPSGTKFKITINMPDTGDIAVGSTIIVKGVSASTLGVVIEGQRVVTELVSNTSVSFLIDSDPVSVSVTDAYAIRYPVIRAYQRSEDFTEYSSGTPDSTSSANFLGSAISLSGISCNSGSNVITVDSTNHGLSNDDKILVTFKGGTSNENSTISGVRTEEKTGTTTINSQTVSLNNVSGLEVGMLVSGLSFDSLTRIKTINSITNTITTTRNATQTILSTPISFYSENICSVTVIDQNQFRYIGGDLASSSISKNSTDSVGAVVKRYGDTNVLDTVSFAVKYYDNLSSFVQGRFINAVSSFVTLPYDDEESVLKVDMSSSIDRRNNVANAIIIDSFTYGTALSPTQTSPDTPSFSTDQIVTIRFGTNQDLRVGDLILAEGATGTGTSGMNGYHIIDNIVETGSDFQYSYKSLDLPSGTSGATSTQMTITKVDSLSCRFCRDPYTNLNQINWNSSTSDLETSDYREVPSGTAKLLFSGSHGLVNNDKIVLSGTGVLNLDGTYLVQYSNFNEVQINIEKQRTVTGTSFTRSGTTVTVATSSVHNFSAGDTLLISGTTNYNGEVTIGTVPTATSFTYEISTTPANETGLSATIYYGVIDTSNANADTGDITSVSSIVVARPINVSEFAEISVGGLIEIRNDNDLHYFMQVRKIRGDGTSPSDIVLNVEEMPYETVTGTDSEDYGIFGAVGTVMDLAGIRFPVTSGILRAGFTLDFPNTQVGLAQKLQDYSIKKELPTGSYYYLNRDTAREFSGKIVGSAQQIDNMVQFAREYMGQPFAVLILEDMDLNEKTALYAYFPDLPSVSFTSKIDSIREVSFSMKEVL